MYRDPLFEYQFACQSIVILCLSTDFDEFIRGQGQKLIGNYFRASKDLGNLFRGCETLSLRRK